MKTIELLSPVGDFECLKAAVQNGADSVYLGATNFSARASATNFNLNELETSIKYAKLRNVDVHLTLNTLIQENELNDALELANTAYSYGVDAIIVQDFGLANLLIKNFPKLAIHASTQMTVHNLEGVKELEKLGFSRVVLARELSINEIKYICENSNIEIEAFIHGALCISYSGRCYISSLIGGRSGNRGKCAQACRLPYKLYNSNDKLMDSGYLLSPRDLCSLEHLPELVNSGVSSFKIEGRMKTPEYVATVTRIYRKYLNKIINNEKYEIEENDVKELMQVFNRGGFSSAHLKNESNRKLIFPLRPNNLGLLIGNVEKYQSGKGYITLNPEEKIEIGDSIVFENENTKYTISELMENEKNIKSAINKVVQIGRMKGNIKVGDKIYKIASKTHSKIAEKSYEKEFKKINLNAKIIIKEGFPIELTIFPNENEKSIYSGITVSLCSDIIPEKANNQPISLQRIEDQIRKTGNTQFNFKNIEIDLQNDLHIPSISKLNELRRNALIELEKRAIKRYQKEKVEIKQLPIEGKKVVNKKISLLLNTLNLEFDYSKLEKIDYVYIPLEYYLKDSYSHIINNFVKIYVYMPSITRKSQVNNLKNSIEQVIKNYNIAGFVISNFADLEFLPNDSKYEIIANHTFNVFNNQTIQSLKNLNFSRITSSIELPKNANNMLDSSNIETIVYGRAPVMTLNYCLLGKSNHCYKECPKFCENGNYYIKDRMNFTFPLIVENKQTITTIFNSKISSIFPNNTSASIYRIDITSENIEEINEVIKKVKNNDRLEGQEYTNANMNREI